MAKKLNAKDKQGIALGLFVLTAFLGIFIFIAMPKPEGCPKCDQHYLFIDNSEKISQRDLNKLEFEESGQGLVSRIWRELEVGDQLNVLAFDQSTFDPVYLSKGEMVKPIDLENINEFTQGKRKVKAEFDEVKGKIDAVLDSLPKQGMGQTKVMAGLYDLGVAIANHRANFRKEDGTNFDYRIIIVSDLLEHSDLYDAYSSSRKDFSEWSSGSKARAGLAALDGVKVDVYQVQRGVDQQNDSLDKFWSDYFNASGAYPVTPEDF